MRWRQASDDACRSSAPRRAADRSTMPLESVKIRAGSAGDGLESGKIALDTPPPALESASPAVDSPPMTLEMAKIDMLSMATCLDTAPIALDTMSIGLESASATLKSGAEGRRVISLDKATAPGHPASRARSHRSRDARCAVNKCCLPQLLPARDVHTVRHAVEDVSLDEAAAGEFLHPSAPLSVTPAVSFAMGSRLRWLDCSAD